MKKYLIIILFSVAGLTVNAQSLWNITYNMAVPLGDTKNFVDKTSFRGIGVDGRSFINQNISLGGSWGWNVFYNREENITVIENNITVTGNHSNYGNYMPIMANGHYYFGNDGEIRPFIGAGIGTIWKEERKDVGSFNAFTDNNWQFGFTPEMGFFLPITTTGQFFVNIKYTYGISTKNLSATSYFNFGVGFAWENF